MRTPRRISLTPVSLVTFFVLTVGPVAVARTTTSGSVTAIASQPAGAGCVPVSSRSTKPTATRLSTLCA